jgi:hypothetical protein
MLSAIAFVVFALWCTVMAFRRHPIYGLAFYLATTYVFPQGRWWGEFLGETRWALIAAAVTICAVAMHRGKLNPKPHWLGSAPAVIMTLYAAWMWLETPLALALAEHIEGTIKYTKYVLSFWFFYRIIDSREHLRDVLLLHVLGCTLLGVLAFMQGRTDGRLDGVGGPGIDDSNTLGMYLVTGTLVAFGLFLTETGWRRWLCLPCMVLTANGFVLANSRGAFLGFVAGGLVILLCKARRHRRMFWAFALVGALGFVSLIDQTFITRMYTIEDVTSESPEADSSARSRVEVARAQLQMFLDYPAGTGHRGTVVLSPRYLDRVWLTTARGEDEDNAARSSHNSFLTALVEQGFIGAMLFAGYLFWTLGAIVRLRRYDKRGGDPNLVTLSAAMCGALTAVFVAGNTADYLMAEVQFWLYAGIVSALQFFETAQAARLRDRLLAPLQRSPA